MFAKRICTTRYKHSSNQKWEKAEISCYSTFLSPSYCLKPTALRFHFQPWPTIYTNLPLAVFPSLVWNKHWIFLRSAESQLLWNDLAMLPLVVAWTTTRSRKRHGETLEYCTKKNYIQLLTTEMWYLQIFVRFRLNKGEKNRQSALMKWLSLFV